MRLLLLSLLLVLGGLAVWQLSPEKQFNYHCNQAVKILIENTPEINMTKDVNSFFTMICEQAYSKRREWLVDE